MAHTHGTFWSQAFRSLLEIASCVCRRSPGLHTFKYLTEMHTLTGSGDEAHFYIAFGVPCLHVTSLFLGHCRICILYIQHQTSCRLGHACHSNEINFTSMCPFFLSDKFCLFILAHTTKSDVGATGPGLGWQIRFINPRRAGSDSCPSEITLTSHPVG